MRKLPALFVLNRALNPSHRFSLAHKSFQTEHLRIGHFSGVGR